MQISSRSNARQLLPLPLLQIHTYRSAFSSFGVFVLIWDNTKIHIYVCCCRPLAGHYISAVKKRRGNFNRTVIVKFCLPPRELRAVSKCTQPRCLWRKGVARKRFIFPFWCHVWGVFCVVVGTGDALLAPEEKCLHTNLTAQEDPHSRKGLLTSANLIHAFEGSTDPKRCAEPWPEVEPQFQ